MKRFALPFLTLIAVTLALPRPAQAAATITFSQSGSSVVITGSGSLNVTGLGAPTPVGGAGTFNPALNSIIIGTVPTSFDLYSTTVTGPSNFGTGFGSPYSSGSGDNFGFFQPGNRLYVPRGYVSGAPLTSNNTIANATLSGIGATPGTYIYTYTYNSGTDSDTITLQIGAVPEPSTWALLSLGVVGMGTALRRRAQRV